MLKTFLSVNVVLANNSEDGLARFIKEFRALSKQSGHTEFGFSVNQHEAHDATQPDFALSSDGGAAVGGRVERRRSEAGDRAAADFAEGGDAEGAGQPEADAGKRKPGRPRKSDAGTGAGGGAEAGSGSAEGGRKRSTGKAGDAAQGTVGTEPVGTRQGAGEGPGEGEGRRGGPDGGRDDQRGNRAPARISTSGDRGEAPSDDWNEDPAPAATTPAKPEPHPNAEEGEDWWAKTPDTDVNEQDRPVAYWPDHLMPAENINEGVLGVLLGEHFTATGGKDRIPTFALMEEVTGERQVKNVHPDDYDNLARHLLKDAARYRHGVKKAK